MFHGWMAKLYIIRTIGSCVRARARVRVCVCVCFTEMKRPSKLWKMPRQPGNTPLMNWIIIFKMCNTAKAPQSISKNHQPQSSSPTLNNTIAHTHINTHPHTTKSTPEPLSFGENTAKISHLYYRTFVECEWTKWEYILYPKYGYRVSFEYYIMNGCGMVWWPIEYSNVILMLMLQGIHKSI